MSKKTIKKIKLQSGKMLQNINLQNYSQISNIMKRIIDALRKSAFVNPNNQYIAPLVFSYQTLEFKKKKTCRILNFRKAIIHNIRRKE